MKKKIYSNQFKREVVCSSFECKSIKDLAEKFEIDVQHIYEWRKLFVDELMSDPTKGMSGSCIGGLKNEKKFKTIHVKGNVSDFSALNRAKK